MTNKATLGTHAQNPAELSPTIEQHLIRVENRLSAAQMALEMMTVADYTNRKSTKDLLSDCERLQKAAVELHQAMCGNDQAAPRVDLYAFLSEPKEQTSNASQPAAPAKPKATTAKQSKNESRSLINRRQRGRYIDIQDIDWKEVFRVCEFKEYKGMKVKVDGKTITIKTFEQYCENVIGLGPKQVKNYMKIIMGLNSLEGFQALHSLGLTMAGLKEVCKLTDDQKQALLQVAQTGDKAATLQFIEQALQTGEQP